MAVPTTPWEEPHHPSAKQPLPRHGAIFWELDSSGGPGSAVDVDGSTYVKKHFSACGTFQKPTARLQ
jgi:hypothetical protein